MLGDHHVDTLTAMSSLAFILQKSGQPDESLELYAEALEGRLESLGEDSPWTLDSMHDVANNLVDLANLAEISGDSDPGRRLGFLESARELNARVLERRRQLLGDEAPKTLSSAANLADTMRALGDLGAAHELNLKILETRRRVLGPEHPDTLTTLNNIAVGLYQAGDQQGASETMAYVLDASSRVLGADHPRTLETMFQPSGGTRKHRRSCACHRPGRTCRYRTQTGTGTGAPPDDASIHELGRRARKGIGSVHGTRRDRSSGT